MKQRQRKTKAAYERETVKQTQRRRGRDTERHRLREIARMRVLDTERSRRDGGAKLNRIRKTLNKKLGEAQYQAETDRQREKRNIG